MPQVHIPTPLRKYTGNQDAVSVAGGDAEAGTSRRLVGRVSD